MNVLAKVQLFMSLPLAIRLTGARHLKASMQMIVTMMSTNSYVVM